MTDFPTMLREAVAPKKLSQPKVKERYRLLRLERYIPVPESGCWLWTGDTSQYGYGKFRIGAHAYGCAHRFFYEQLVGPIPDGLCVLHKCDTRLCVNPGHLFLGTKKDNWDDSVRKGRAFYQVKKDAMTPPAGRES